MSVDWNVAGAIIDDLRSEECVVVGVVNDNADFNGLPNCMIYVSAEWTSYKDKPYRADTLIACLELARKDRDEARA